MPTSITPTQPNFGSPTPKQEIFALCAEFIKMQVQYYKANREFLQISIEEFLKCSNTYSQQLSTQANATMAFTCSSTIFGVLGPALPNALPRREFIQTLCTTAVNVSQGAITALAPFSQAITVKTQADQQTWQNVKLPGHQQVGSNLNSLIQQVESALLSLQKSSANS